MSQVKADLSNNDSRVLGALFDPESSPSSTIQIIDPSLPGLSQFHPDLLKSLQAQEVAAIRPLNTPNPSTTSIEKAISSLTHLIEQYPNYPSAWNNRAQATRMLVGDDLNDQAASSSTLFSDLCQAITLASPSQPSDPISPFQAKILASSHSHRGHLLLRLSRSRSMKPAGGEDRNLPGELRGFDTDRLEEMASRDLFLGGRYGNGIARQLGVQTNPYAKLCGSIVKESMRRDFEMRTI
ncbi:MAG: hypothetical protein M1834_001148 [Cirrosporium novae-zelandiae]|nr:MAG: hypothetical protein M1834_001148 [Cirrosporium novae-zelandiae]